MIENYDTQNNKKSSSTKAGRLLDYNDNWCLLPQNITNVKQWKNAPHPHRGHPVLYVPGHWGSFSQARSIGAHGTRWAGRSTTNKALYSIYDSFVSGEGMHDGRNLIAPKSEDQFVDWFQSTYSLSYLNDFVMDVYSLDFNAEGAALHSSRLLRQAEFFARAVETMVEGCHLYDSGITIVAHSIGAWVVRIALKMHPHLVEKGLIRNVISLASPLGGVPYAVDASVHEISSHLNDDDSIHGNVTFISVSGGLRDELIPPEACEIPSISNATKTSSSGDAFLASTIMNRNLDSKKYQFGMDHRAIVWCYDLLKVVREVIFALVVTTDQDMTSQNRLNVARRVMVGKHLEKQSFSGFRLDVEQQRNSLLSERGYVKVVAIQLASPYHLNSLLKLTISALLLDLHVLTPMNRASSHFTTLQNASNKMLLVPLLLTSIFSIRRAFICHGHECELLLGTVFVLSQLAVSIYLMICIVLSPLFAAGIRICSKQRDKANQSEGSSMRKSYGAIMAQYMVQQLCLLVLMVAPMVVVSIYTINYFYSGATNTDLVWNKVSIASYCFVSIMAMLLWCFMKYLVTHSGRSSRTECKVVLVFLLSTVKATHGTILYAYSLTTQWRQIESDLYDEFLAITKSKIGSVFGHHNELFLCLVTIAVPTLLAINAVEAYTKMKFHFIEAGIKVHSKPERHRGLIMATTSLAFWYSWNAFVSISQDDYLIPAYATIILLIYYLKSIPISSEAIDIYSAVANSDLSLCCSVAKDHNKEE
jgi:hypothetical protein